MDKGISLKDIKTILSFLNEADEIFKCILPRQKSEILTKNLKELILKREEYRQQKNWQKADEIRKKIAQMGYQIEDTKKGPAIKKIYGGP